LHTFRNHPTVIIFIFFDKEKQLYTHRHDINIDMASFPGSLQLLTTTLHLHLHIIYHMSSSASSHPSSFLQLLPLGSLLSCRRHRLANSSTPPVSHSSVSCAFYSRQYLFYFSSFFSKQIRLTTTFKIKAFHITMTLFKTPRHHNDIYPYINNYDDGI
jgi:hypothetical protein